MAQPAEFEQVTYNSPDGAQMGRTSTDAISFYGNTPAARPQTVSTLDVSTTSSQSTSSGAGIGFGFPSLAEYQNLVTAVSTMQATMKRLGLLANS
jgi:hypothetical protein